MGRGDDAICLMTAESRVGAGQRECKSARADNAASRQDKGNVASARASRKLRRGETKEGVANEVT